MNAPSTSPIAARAQLLAEAGYFAPDSDEGVPSPCIAVCRMTADNSHCEGCFRTIPEIRAWASAEPEQRLAIWRQLSQRAGFDFPPASSESAQPSITPS